MLQIPFFPVAAIARGNRGKIHPMSRQKEFPREDMVC